MARWNGESTNKREVTCRWVEVIGAPFDVAVGDHIKGLGVVGKIAIHDEGVVIYGSDHRWLLLPWHRVIRVEGTTS